MRVWIMQVDRDRETWQNKILGVYASRRAAVAAKREYDKAERAWVKSRGGERYEAERAEIQKFEVCE